MRLVRPSKHWLQSKEFIEINSLDYLEHKISEEWERILADVDILHQVLAKNRNLIDRLNQEFIEYYLKSIKL